VKNEKILIGRSEKVDLPELGLVSLEAKIDSGAFTSSLHCLEIHPFYLNQQHFVSFTIFDGLTPLRREAPVFTSRLIRTSGGYMSYRFVIKTSITISGKNYVTEISLTDRSNMRYQLLLGRKLLGNRFIIDVSRQNISSVAKRKRKSSS
jgi:hypothetical protein